MRFHATFRTSAISGRTLEMIFVQCLTESKCYRGFTVTLQAWKSRVGWMQAANSNGLEAVPPNRLSSLQGICSFCTLCSTQKTQQSSPKMYTVTCAQAKSALYSPIKMKYNPGHWAAAYLSSKTLQAAAKQWGEQFIAAHNQAAPGSVHTAHSCQMLCSC